MALTSLLREEGILVDYSRYRRTTAGQGSNTFKADMIKKDKRTGGDTDNTLTSTGQRIIIFPVSKATSTGFLNKLFIPINVIAFAIFGEYSHSEAHFDL